MEATSIVPLALISCAVACLFALCAIIRRIYIKTRPSRRNFPKHVGELDLILDPAIDYQDDYVPIRGRDIYRQIYRPKDTPIVGVVLFFHGISADAFSSLMHHTRTLTSNGIAVVCFDFEGHGRSDGVHGYCTLENVLKDAEHLVSLLQQHPTLSFPPLFLMGVSMGAYFALEYARRHPQHIAGVVVVASAVVVAEEAKPSAFTVLLGRAISAVFPELPLQSSKSNGWSDTQAQALYRDYKLGYFGPWRVGLGLEVLTALEELCTKLGEIRTPLLVQHGRNDKVVDVRGAEMLYSAAKSPDKSLVVYDDCNHVLLEEPKGQAEAIVSCFTKWIHERCVESYDYRLHVPQLSSSAQPELRWRLPAADPVDIRVA